MYMMKLIDASMLIDAIDSVTWYNGLAEIIVKWKNEDYFVRFGDSSFSWNWNTFNSYDIETRSQLQVIWIICVELFGECGTSPRSGWILMKNKEEFYKFIDRITETYITIRQEEGEQNV